MASISLGRRVDRLQAAFRCRDEDVRLRQEEEREENGHLASHDPEGHFLLRKGALMLNAYLRLHPELEPLRGNWDALLPAFEPAMREQLTAIMGQVDQRVAQLLAQGVRPGDQPGPGPEVYPELPDFLRVPYEAAFGAW